MNTLTEMSYYESLELDTKRKFLTLLDGVSNYPGIVENLNSFYLGVTKLEYKHRVLDDDILIVHLRRPGLLIGKGGEVINKFREKLEMDIGIEEVILGR